MVRTKFKAKGIFDWNKQKRRHGSRKTVPARGGIRPRKYRETLSVEMFLIIKTISEY